MPAAVQISQVSFKKLIKSYNDLVDEHNSQPGAGSTVENGLKEHITLNDVEINSLTQAIAQHSDYSPSNVYLPEEHYFQTISSIDTTLLPLDALGTVHWVNASTGGKWTHAAGGENRQQKKRPVEYQLEFDHEFFRM
jgi:hypothetical protein